MRRTLGEGKGQDWLYNFWEDRHSAAHKDSPKSWVFLNEERQKKAAGIKKKGERGTGGMTTKEERNGCNQKRQKNAAAHTACAWEVKERSKNKKLKIKHVPKKSEVSSSAAGGGGRKKKR